MRLDPGVLDLLLSRLLHDLIGPVTATVNGIELIEEFGDTNNDSIAQEALELISSSAKQSADRLSYFRIAFGGAGNGEEHNLETVRRLAGAYLASRKISFDFTTDLGDGEKPGPGIAKTILAAIFLLADALPRSGGIQLEINATEDWTTTITAQGPGALIEADNIAGLTGADTPVDLTTRSVIGAIVGQTASRFGIHLEVHGEAELARITLRAP